MALLPSDISRLVHHHLLKEGYVKSANTLVEESPHLLGLPKPDSKPYKLPRLIGPALVDLLEAFFETKDYVIEELESLDSVNYKEHESLSALIKTLLDALKSRGPASSVPTKVTQTCDASCNTEAPVQKETRDAVTNTDEISSQPTKCDASCNTEASPQKESEDASNVTEKADPIITPGNQKNVVEASPGLSSNSSLTCTEDMVELQQDDTIESSPGTGDDADDGIIDFSMIYDRLLEDTKLHEKIAESINKKKSQVHSPCKEPAVNDATESSLTQDLSSVIKAIVAETQSDPAFEDILRDCIGIDATQDASAVKDTLPIENQNQEEVQNSVIALNTAPPLALNPLSTYTIVSGPNGQPVLVPAGALMNPDAAPAIKEKKPPKPKIPKPNKKPPVPKTIKKDSSGRIAILPRPEPPAPAPMIITVTIPEILPEEDHPPPVNQQVSAAVASAVKEAIADFTLSSPNKPRPGSSGQRKPFMKMNRPIKKISHKKRLNHHRLVTVPLPPPAAASSMTPALADLLKLAGEQCKAMESASTEEEAEILPAEPAEPVVTTPSADPSAIVTTPTSTNRRRSHVRQLHFGESPSDVPSSPVTSRPPVKRSSPKKDQPWDSFLRTAAVTPVEPEKSNKKKVIFATPKGKAKRARKKSSPLASSEEKEKETLPVTEPVSVEGDAENPIEKTGTIIAEEASLVEDPIEKTDTIIAEEASSMEDPIEKTGTIIAEETSPVAAPNNNNNFEQRISPEKQKEAPPMDPPPVPPNCGPAPSTIVPEVIFQQPLPALPVLATPRKDPEENGGAGSLSCDGQSSSSFGAWIGEIPRTPQIQLDQNRSTSPFLVSLTKGFGFLPAADSPSLAVPATPSIESFSASGSIETPYTGFYQFPTTLNTPRVDALRQESMESPGKTLGTTMISPTQVVLGRSAPYFVPSGERAQGPVINQNATPEHIPEPDKLDPSRRSSLDMEPLQLEESNDASDAAAALMRQAAASATAALLEEKRQLEPPTPAKTDHSLESALISECRRLEDQPSKAQRYIELFGEDSTTPNDLVLPEAAKKDATKEAKKPKKSSKAKESSCARIQAYVPTKRQNKPAAVAIEVSPAEPHHKSRKRPVNSPGEGEEAPGTKRSRKSSKRKSASSLNSSKEEVDVLHVPKTVPAKEKQTTLAPRRSGRTPKKNIESVRPSPNTSAQEIDVLLVDPVVTNKAGTSTTKNSIPDEPSKLEKVQTKTRKVPQKNPLASPPPEKTRTPRKASPTKLSKPGLPPRGRKAISLNQMSGNKKTTCPSRNAVPEVVNKEPEPVVVLVEVAVPTDEANDIVEEPLPLNLTVEKPTKDVGGSATSTALEQPAEVVTNADVVQLSQPEQHSSTSAVPESIPTAATNVETREERPPSAEPNMSALDYLGLLPSLGTKVSTKIRPERVEPNATPNGVPPQPESVDQQLNPQELRNLERNFVNQCQKMLSFSQEICLFSSK